MKVAGRWTYLYWAIDQHGQVIDVQLSVRRDLAAARRFFTRALRAGAVPVEVNTDRAAAYPRVLDELIPSALHTTDRYANNPVEADHGRLKARLRPMRGLTPPVRLDPGRWLCAWSRTCAAGTTKSPPISPPASAYRQPSTSSRRPFDSQIIPVSVLRHPHRSANAKLPGPDSFPAWASQLRPASCL